jgi:hypothetical protein
MDPYRLVMPGVVASSASQCHSFQIFVIHT